MDQHSRRIEIRTTSDGSHTLYVPELNEHFHSVFGAVTESLHIFIHTGLRCLPEHTQPARILEVGFGTGLNALLTCLYAEENHSGISYSTVEKYPLPEKMALQLNYAGFLNSRQAENRYRKIIKAPWDEWVTVSRHFNLMKIDSDLFDCKSEPGVYDLVYFDAFGPDVQPELWSSGVFMMLHEWMKPGGILVTYSTKGAVKRNLKAAGFAIEKLPGPPGKREILRASKVT